MSNALPRFRQLLAWMPRLLAVLALCGGFTSCSLVPEVKINPMSFDIPLTGDGFDLSLFDLEKEDKDKKSGFVERIVRRIAGPPTVMAGLTLQYRAEHGQWPTQLEDLDSSQPFAQKTLKRIKSATFTPQEDGAVELSLLYDKNIPANVLLTIERVPSSS